MRRKATIKAVYTLCNRALDGKSPVEYTLYDKKLRYQRSALRTCWQSYVDFDQRQVDVQEWIVEFERKGCLDKIVADTWRWCLGINKKLPVKIQKQR
ncbi:MAG: hypothetical protein IKB10_04200 [Alphaproteobacteria bacterium]|nr:hypothetical protein [Alphaproteobacteria bacterium]